MQHRDVLRPHAIHRDSIAGSLLVHTAVGMKQAGPPPPLLSRRASVDAEAVQHGAHASVPTEHVRPRLLH